jgi:hypothetical protein
LKEKNNFLSANDNNYNFFDDDTNISTKLQYLHLCDEIIVIKNGEAIKHDYENKIVQYLFGMETTYPPMLSEQSKIPYGLCSNGFDIGSIQFALHYMFDSEESVTKFVSLVKSKFVNCHPYSGTNVS